MKPATLLIAITCTAFTLSAASWTQAAEPGGDLPVVVLLGDSIRMNYQQTVVTELEGKATVWSPQENGKDTFYTLQKLPTWLDGRDVSVVHINVGLHDLFLNSSNDQPRHSLDVYSTNLRSIFAKLKELTDAEVMFALTTPVVEERQAQSETYGRVVRRNADIIKYNQRAAEIAHALGVRVNDVHATSIDAGVDDVIRDDGVHLSKQGVEVIGKQVAKSVLSVLQKSTE